MSLEPGEDAEAISATYTTHTRPGIAPCVELACGMIPGVVFEAEVGGISGPVRV